MAAIRQGWVLKFKDGTYHNPNAKASGGFTDFEGAKIYPAIGQCKNAGYRKYCHVKHRCLTHDELGNQVLEVEITLKEPT